ncbi:hypothetical protein EF384_00140 [Aerococcus agrisoli]|uniref:Cytosolic protein n=1 Tax=Aerococcus agrisoli TaxID=2487350 RepID=A0A3N4GVH5_9LACT|nr:DUF6282 family protein [Aerococcus agrisoli]RPA65447.1 hypothetical protein EF384_00140 [Aerococcus agrisoli]
MDRSILQGAYDVHVHAGPSSAKRFEDAYEMYQEASAAGYAGFVVKDHNVPALLGTAMINKHNPGPTRAYGALVLNNSVGGFNVFAVDTAFNYGAAMVYFPTVSSRMHLETRKEGFVGAAESALEEIPLAYTDDKGEVVPEAVACLQYMADHDMVLGTGHGYPEEVDAVVKKALDLGVKRIVVTHPHYQVDATIADMVKWADMGAYIEINACVFEGGHSVVENVIPLQVAKDMIDAVGADRIIIDTDFGQKANGSPVEGLYNFLTLLHDDYDVSEEDISKMIKDNPAKCFGFDRLKVIE